MGSGYRGVWPASASSIGVRFRDDRGRWVREFVPIPPTAKNLRAWAARREVIRQEIAEGRFDYARWFPWSKRARRGLVGHETVEDLLNAWLRRQEKVLEETSLRKCRQVVDNVLIPTFGAIPAAEFTPGHVQDWIDAHELTRKTTSNYLWPLRQSFAQAVHIDRTLVVDPLVNYKVRRRRLDRQRTKRAADPFFADELAAAIAKAQPDLRPFVRFNIWTGLRLEEMLELHWQDVNLAGKRIWVHRARVGRIEKGPKTAASERYVTLLPDAIRALEVARALSYVPRGHAFICLRTERPWSGDALRDAWRRACGRAGVRYRAPKHFRHTFAHRMLTAGENLAAISAELGHKDVAVTARVYAGFLPELDGPRFGALAAQRYGENNSNLARCAASHSIVECDYEVDPFSEDESKAVREPLD